MSVERDGYNGPIVFVCDSKGCPEFTETYCSDWGGALAKIKSRGWAVRKVGAEWRHYCFDCATDA